MVTSYANSPLGQLSASLPVSSSVNLTPSTPSSISSSAAAGGGALSTVNTSPSINQQQSLSQAYAQFKAQQIIEGKGTSAYSISPADRYFLESTSQGQSLLAEATKLNPNVVASKSQAPAVQTAAQTAEAYAKFKASQIAEAMNKGVASAYSLTQEDRQLLEKSNDGLAVLAQVMPYYASTDIGKKSDALAKEILTGHPNQAAFGFTEANIEKYAPIAIAVAKENAAKLNMSEEYLARQLIGSWVQPGGGGASVLKAKPGDLYTVWYAPGLPKEGVKVYFPQDLPMSLAPVAAPKPVAPPVVAPAAPATAPKPTAPPATSTSSQKADPLAALLDVGSPSQPQGFGSMTIEQAKTAMGGSGQSTPASITVPTGSGGAAVLTGSDKDIQKVMADAYQQAAKDAEKAALASGTSVTLSQEKIGQKAVELLTNPVVPTASAVAPPVTAALLSPQAQKATDLSSNVRLDFRSPPPRDVVTKAIMGDAFTYATAAGSEKYIDLGSIKGAGTGRIFFPSNAGQDDVLKALDSYYTDVNSSKDVAMLYVANSQQAALASKIAKDNNTTLASLPSSQLKTLYDLLSNEGLEGTWAAGISAGGSAKINDTIRNLVAPTKQEQAIMSLADRPSSGGGPSPGTGVSYTVSRSPQYIQQQFKTSPDLITVDPFGNIQSIISDKGTVGSVEGLPSTGGNVKNVDTAKFLYEKYPDTFKYFSDKGLFTSDEIAQVTFKPPPPSPVAPAPKPQAILGDTGFMDTKGSPAAPVSGSYFYEEQRAKEAVNLTPTLSSAATAPPAVPAVSKADADLIAQYGALGSMLNPNLTPAQASAANKQAAEMKAAFETAPQKQAETQAIQKLMTEAFVETSKQAQKEALATGLPVELTTEKVSKAAVDLISPGGKYESGIPIVDNTSLVAYQNQVQGLLSKGYSAEVVNGNQLQFTKSEPASPAAAADYAKSLEKGAADFAILSPVSGKLGVYEGVGTAGNLEKFVASKDDSSKVVNISQIKVNPDSIITTTRQVPLAIKSGVATAPELTAQQQREAEFLAKIPEKSGNPLEDVFKGVAAPIENLANVLYTTGYTISKLPEFIAGDSAQAWYDMAYQQREMQKNMKGDIEGDLTSLGLTAAVQGIQTGKTDVTAEEAGRMLQLAYEKNPAYLAGNLITSTAMWVGPGLAAKVAKEASVVGDVSKVESNLLKGAVQGAEKAGVETPTSIQAVKFTKDEAATVPLSKSLFGGYTEQPLIKNVVASVKIPFTDISLGIPKVDISKQSLKLVKPDAYVLSTGEKEVGVIDARSGKALFGISEGIDDSAALTGQSLVEKQLLRSEDPLQKLLSEPPVQAKGIAQYAGVVNDSAFKPEGLYAESVTQIGRSIPRAEKVGEVLKLDPEVLRAVKDPLNPKMMTYEPEVLGRDSSFIVRVPDYYLKSAGVEKGVEPGMIAEYSLSDLRKAAEGAAAEASLAKIAKGEGEAGAATKNVMKPRSFENVPKAPEEFGRDASKSLLEVVSKEKEPLPSKVLEYAKALGNSAEKSSESISSGVKYGLGGGADIYKAAGSIGFGGATGAEKVHGKGGSGSGSNMNDYYDTQYLAYPPSSSKGIAGAGAAGNDIAKLDASLKNSIDKMVNDMSSFSNKLRPDTSQGINNKLNESTNNIIKDLTGMGSDIMTGQKQNTSVKQNLDEITRTDAAEGYGQSLKQLEAQITKTIQDTQFTMDYDQLKIPIKIKKVPFEFPPPPIMGAYERGKSSKSDDMALLGLRVWSLEKLENVGAFRYREEKKFY